MLDGMSPYGGAGDAARLCVCRKYPSNGGYLRALKDEADACKDDADEYTDHKVVRSHSDDYDGDLFPVRTRSYQKRSTGLLSDIPDGALGPMCRPTLLASSQFLERK